MHAAGGGIHSHASMRAAAYGGSWFSGLAFADLAAVADFNRDRYAITSVPLGSIATASVAELCVKRSCTFAEWFAFTASSTAARSYRDANGILRNDLAVDQPRFDWLNGKRQLALNGQSTNSIHNPRMEGPTPGTPGTPPAGMFATLVSGVQRTVMPAGIEDGIPYYEFRLFGTPSVTGNCSIGLITGAVAPALAGQTWAHSLYQRLSAGSAANCSFSMTWSENNSAGSFVAGTVVAMPVPTGAPLAAQRVGPPARTLSGGGTVANLQVYHNIGVTGGLAIDITMRIAGPQLEQAAFNSPLVLPAPGITNAATIRAIESARMSPVIEAILQRSAASVVVRGQNMLRSGGRIVGTGSGSSSAQLLRSSNNFASMNTGGSVETGSTDGTALLNVVSWAGAMSFDASRRSVVRSGGAVATDSSITVANRASIYLGRDGGGNGGDGHYDFVGIAPSRLSDARLTALAVPA